MPTNKTPFTFHIDSERLDKIRSIAKRETRSLSKPAGISRSSCPAPHSGAGHLGKWSYLAFSFLNIRATPPCGVARIEGRECDNF